MKKWRDVLVIHCYVIIRPYFPQHHERMSSYSLEDVLFGHKLTPDNYWFVLVLSSI